MKWIKGKPPQHGEKRERHGFLMWPKTTRQTNSDVLETRWLCWTTWVEMFHEGDIYANNWVDAYWSTMEWFD